VWQEALTASDELARIDAELTYVQTQLEDPSVYGDETILNRTLNRQAQLLDAYVRLGGPSYEGRVRSTLLGLDFAENELTLPTDVLSGGQKKLVGLAKLLVTQPDILLLDEPDNHLDLGGKAFLEQFIKSYKGAVIIVSHDRYLLDLIVDEIAELEDGKLTFYPGTYSEYAIEKELHLLRQQRLYEAQQKEIARIEAAIARFEQWASIVVDERHARQARSRRKMLERMDKIDKPILERRSMGLELNGWRGSNKALEIVDLDKIFPAASPNEEESIILIELNLLIWRGARVGIVGPNGAGKSLLFRLILDQEPPTGGEIKIGPSVKIGYYAQEHETLDYKRTLIETVRHATKMSEQDAVRFLGRFLFSYEQARGVVGNLSGGERSRLQMALLMLSDANFLLLDEPTNNLDIRSAEVLENALAEFEGSMLIISHDRYFLDRVVDRIAELEDGTLTEYLGGYSDYQSTKALK
jgi:ATP-binding cassette subfamily F protein 3